MSHLFNHSSHINSNSRSLSLNSFWNANSDADGFVASLNSLLGAHEGTLEALSIDGMNLSRALRLPASLRRLSLVVYKPAQRVSNTPRTEPLLLDENLETLAGGELLSLKLFQPIPLPTLDYVCAFTRLRHLSIQLIPANIPSFTSALAHLPHLRAVELYCNAFWPSMPQDHYVAEWDGILRALGANRPELEHLALAPWILNPIEPAVLPPELLLQFEHLVSLEMRERVTEDEEIHWGWLEALAEKNQLEHLVVEPLTMEEELMCRVLSKCTVCSHTPISPLHTV